jgi:DNA polymerase III subunit delta
VKIAARQLAASVKKGLAPLYTIHGAEPLGALEAADFLREAARKDGCTQREVFTAEQGADWSQLAATAANLSLFATRRLIEVRIPTGRPGAEGGERIEAYCKRLPEGDVTLVLLPELDWRSIKTQWFSALEGAGVVVESKPITRDELPEWLADRLARQKQRASVETLEWLADRVEGNLLAAKQEVEKLALLLPEGEIALDSIRESVTDVSRFERDRVVDAIHAADPARIERVMASLEAEGEPAPLLLWTLTEELRLLMQVKAGERPRRWLDPARMQQLTKTANRHDALSFDRAFGLAHRVDRMVKGVATGSAWDNLLELALGIAGKPAILVA